jgi:NitT/TauT family transport system substrate-binding protein
MKGIRAFALLVAGVLTACGGSAGSTVQSPGTLQKVTLIWVAKAANMAPAWLALDGGYFRQQGLDVDMSYVNGSPSGMAALVAGGVDFLEVAGTAVVSAGANTTDNSKKPVTIVGTVNRGVFKLMVHKSITSTDQLKGKTVCITKAGTADEAALRTYLKRQSLSDRDVTILSGGSIEGCVATIEAGRAAGGIFSTPNTAVLEQKGFSVLADFAKLNIEFQQLGVAVLKAYADSHRDQVERFVKGYIQGIHRFKVDKQFAQKTIGKYLDITDRFQLDDAYNTYKDVFEKVPVPSDAAMQAVIDAIPQAKGTTPASYIDSRFVTKLEKDGFIKQVYGS